MHTQQAATRADADLERAIELSADGRYDDAARAADSAVDGYRRLAEDEPRVYLPDLATALGALDEALAGQGQAARACEASRESVSLFRTLAAGQAPANPGADIEAALFRPYLAAALSTFSARLHALGDEAAALDAARSAVSLYADITGFRLSGSDHNELLGGSAPPQRTSSTAVDAGEHAAHFAVALVNLAHLLEDAHHLDEAVAAAGDAALLYQQLATVDRAAYLPRLAQTINNHAVLLRQAGKNAVAIATTRQAVNLYRALAQQDSDGYQEYLATALDNLANMMSDAGRGRDALGVAQEATSLYRELASRQDGERFRAPLAASLNNLAIRLAEAGSADDARATTQEASTLYRRLSRDNPRAHLGNLAGTLTNLATDLAAAGQADEALSAAREAVDVTRRLAFGNRRDYLPQLAQAVNNLAVRQHEAGRDSSAAASAHEAVRLYDELCQWDPDRYSEGLERTREFVEFLAAQAV